MKEVCVAVFYVPAHYLAVDRSFGLWLVVVNRLDLV